MPGEDYLSWSTTAASNDTADTAINWREGMARAAVNDSARSLMAAHAKNRNLQNGSIVTTGLPNAQNFASGVGYITAVPPNMRVMLKIGVGLTNPGPATLNMDGIGDIPIKIEGRNLGGGELLAGAYVEFTYDGTNWLLLNSSTLITSTITITEVLPAAPVTVIDFIANIDGTFPEYLFTGINLVPSVLAAELWMLVSTDAGASWETGLDYSWAQAIATEGGVGAIGSHGDSKILIANNIHNASHVGCCFTARVITPSLTSHSTTIELNASSTAALPTTITRWMGSGRFNPLTPVNGIRFLMSTGTITGGSVKLVGIR